LQRVLFLEGPDLLLEVEILSPLPKIASDSETLDFTQMSLPAQKDGPLLGYTLT